MKRTGVREFRNNVSAYLSGDDVVVVERHGHPVGFYIPTGASKREAFNEALERLEETVREITDRTGLSEEDLSRLFTPGEPLPDWASDNRGESKAS